MLPLIRILVFEVTKGISREQKMFSLILQPIVMSKEREQVLSLIPILVFEVTKGIRREKVFSLILILNTDE